MTRVWVMAVVALSAGSTGCDVGDKVTAYLKSASTSDVAPAASATPASNEPADAADTARKPMHPSDTAQAPVGAIPTEPGTASTPSKARTAAIHPTPLAAASGVTQKAAAKQLAPPQKAPAPITAGRLGPAIVPTKTLDASAVPSQAKPASAPLTEQAGKTDQSPRGSAAIGGVTVSGGKVSNAARVVASMRAGFRACYVRALNDDPNAGGSLRLTIDVGPEGAVLAVTAAASGKIPASLIACARARATASQFAAPEGGNAKIGVPVSFVRQ